MPRRRASTTRCSIVMHTLSVIEGNSSCLIKNLLMVHVEQPTYQNYPVTFWMYSSALFIGCIKNN